MTTPALAAQSRCDQWAGSGSKRSWRVFEYGGAWGYLCLIIEKCNRDCIDISVWRYHMCSAVEVFFGGTLRMSQW